MKIGVSTASLFGRLPNEDAIAYFNNVGVSAAEVFLTSFCAHDEDFGALVNERRGQVRVHSVHVLNTQFEPQLFSTYERTKRDAYFWLEKAMRAARKFGATHYTFHGTARYKKRARSGKYDDFNAIANSIAEISEFCAGLGVTLCLENVEWSTCNRPDALKELSARLPSLCTVLDIKQARISGYPYEEYLAHMHNLTHVHVSDVDERGKICLPGKGNFDFPLLFKRLKDKGFDGPVFIEAYKNDYDDLLELKAAVDYLRECSLR